MINQYIPDDKRPVPFNNMVFIGDCETNIPCMWLVKCLGGHAIAVYKKTEEKEKNKADRLIEEKRATLAIPADYSKNTKLEKAVMLMIDKVVSSNNILSYK